MSYILDALRRADAERERGAVPDIHAQNSASDHDDERPARASNQTLIGAIALGLMLLTALAIWRFTASNTPQQAPALQAPTSTINNTVSAGQPATDVVPAPVAPIPVAPLHAPLPTPKPATSVPTNALVKPPTLAVSAPWTRVLTKAELPQDIQRALPNITVGGSVYSDSPASRFVIINGQIYHERDAITPELKLDKIEPRTAIFTFRGLRFSISI